MLNRCQREAERNFDRYGGRGISVCERWHSFEAFLADMGERPEGLSLDRIDNDGNYEPGNCRWATWQEQNRNRRSNRVVEHEGERRPLQEWADLTGLKRETIAYRLNAGWPTARALTEPTRTWS